jgi:2',3'-cyclic-nucleotide 2'-phosphodiesterase (5'-nucleotidase family)
MMRRVRRLLIVHTNDIHGRVEALTRAATLVDRVRAENPDAAVVYLDAGDAEETTSRLSNLTKGAAMHRLLHAAGCRAVAVGNGAVLRYGVEVMPELAAAVPYPHLAANLFRGGKLVEGVQARALLDVDGIRLGVVGLTLTGFGDIYEGMFGCERPPVMPLVRGHTAALLAEGADVVCVLSHLGLDEDRELAGELDGVPLIIGSHSHSLLPEGERVGDVTIVQVGEFGGHVGVVELRIGEGRADVVGARLLDVTDDVPQHPALLAEIDAIEHGLAEWLGEVIGELEQPLDLAYDRPCSSAQFVADVIRERMRAEVAVVTAAAAFSAPLPAGPLTRGALYEACPSPAVVGVAELTGAQLREIVAKGLDREFAADVPRTFRGRPRGLMHLSGAEMRDGQLLVAGDPVDDARLYRVAGTDWELDTYGGYAQREWGLKVEYDMPFILREVVEDDVLAARTSTGR